jgi:predicted GNAT family acetyltransferase
MDGMKREWSNEFASLQVVANPELPAHMGDRVREVVKVWTDPGHRAQGYATELMKQVCEEADVEGVVLILQPRPFENNISKDKLIAWYKRFGFVKLQDKPVLMARAPTFKVRMSMVGAAVEQMRG